jgi:hypothetical protein
MGNCSMGPEGSTTDDCEPGYCNGGCTVMTSVDPIPEACARLDVPPFEGR